MRLSFGNAEAPVELWLTGPPTQNIMATVARPWVHQTSLSLSIFVSICIYIYISQPWMIDDDWAEATDCFMG